MEGFSGDYWAVFQLDREELFWKPQWLIDWQEDFPAVKMKSAGQVLLPGRSSWWPGPRGSASWQLIPVRESFVRHHTSGDHRGASFFVLDTHMQGSQLLQKGATHIIDILSVYCIHWKMFHHMAVKVLFFLLFQLGIKMSTAGGNLWAQTKPCQQPYL